MKTILVPVDYSNSTPRLITLARELCAAFAGRVILLHVAESEQPSTEIMPGLAAPGSTPFSIAVPRDLEREQQDLEKLKEQFTDPAIEVTTLVAEGTTVGTILDEMERQKADLVVIGSHGHGALYDLVLGSVTSGVLKAARCPVLVVPSPRE